MLAEERRRLKRLDERFRSFRRCCQLVSRLVDGNVEILVRTVVDLRGPPRLVAERPRKNAAKGVTSHRRIP